jgi:hypothetical protein
LSCSSVPSFLTIFVLLLLYCSSYCCRSRFLGLCRNLVFTWRIN